MKKYFAFLIGLLMLNGCVYYNKHSIKGQEFQLVKDKDCAEIYLGFSATGNRFYGQAVNNYFGHFTTDKQSIKFDNVGTTMMMGPRAMMEIEGKYLQTLSDVTEYEFDGRTLVLYTPSGDKLVFKTKELIEQEEE